MRKRDARVENPKPPRDPDVMSARGCAQCVECMGWFYPKGDRITAERMCPLCQERADMRVTCAWCEKDKS